MAPNHGVILIVDVDDDRVTQTLLDANLRREGYDTMIASSGEEALRLIERQLPDLILLDAMMAGLNGFDVILRIKNDARTRGIPIIMLTVLNDQASRLQALENGAEEFLSKPVNELELVMRVRNLLRLQQYKERLSTAEAQLVQSEKLTALGRLAAGVAHEINNPMAFVNANLASLRHYITALLAVLERYEASESCMTPEAARDMQRLKEQLVLKYITGDIGNWISPRTA